VKYGMTIAQVRKQWGRIAVVLEQSGSSVHGFAAVCAGRMRGEAFFRGPDSGPFTLRSVVLLRGARTDKGVGIGSTLQALQTAYGAQLIPDPNIDPGYGYFVVDTAAGQRQPTIAFAFDITKQRVEQVSYGIRSTVGGYSGLYRIDC
jgi:hypothetical protein